MQEATNYRLFNAYVRPYLQTLLNIFLVLSLNKKNQLEAFNRQLYRTLHQWYDSRNVEIENLPKYQSIENLAHNHWNKMLRTMIDTEPNIIQDFLQHKQSILYIKEYLTNSALTKERRTIFNKGRIRKNVLKLATEQRPSLLDFVLSYVH